MAKGGKLIFFLVNLVFGLYLINSAFEFVKLPEFFLNINKWIFAVAGVLIILGGVNYLRTLSHRLDY